ncbi:uncharacterized protein SAPINGB_P003621 [Magnusiomyces paraingens]|uniref:C2 domain-containing protein n=1 Tax=Magnusiomyces paraingens TaxID=2606893 RepID=A0A5E8BQ92_9ASCO|nr:uncharacterized protein SAPINGB_P003621 [Saprochaete ingens]VVT53533.1 unnamed protein product [Saprochaete ingens]
MNPEYGFGSQQTPYFTEDQRSFPQYEGQSTSNQNLHNFHDNSQQHSNYIEEQVLANQFQDQNISNHSQYNFEQHYEPQNQYFHNPLNYDQQNSNIYIPYNQRSDLNNEVNNKNYYPKEILNPQEIDPNHSKSLYQEHPYISIPQVSNFTTNYQINHKDENSQQCLPFTHEQNQQYFLPEPSLPPPAPPALSVVENLLLNSQKIPQPSEPPPPLPVLKSSSHSFKNPPSPPLPISQSSTSVLLPVDSDSDSDSESDIGIYLIKSAIVRRKLENLKTITVNTTPPQIPSSQTFLNVPQSSSSISNRRASTSSTHSFHRHSRQSSVSSEHSTKSHKSIDFKSIFVKTDGSDSGILFSKFTENLKIKVVRDYTTTKIFSDPLTRNMIEKFINDLTPEKIKQLDKEKRLEGIITLFIHCANEVLLTQGNNSYQNISDEISRHTNEFVNYLIFYIEKSSRGLIFSKKSALIKDLKNYSESLEKNTRLEPKKTIVKPISESRKKRYGTHWYSSNPPTDDIGSSSKSNLSIISPTQTLQAHSNSSTSQHIKQYTTKKIERNNDYTVDFQNDSIFKYIIELFDISQEVIPLLSKSLVSLATDTAALNDLRKCEYDLQLGTHPVYSLGNFSSEDVKKQWIKQENINISNDIKSLKEKAPYLNDEPQTSIDELSSYIFIPLKPIESFKKIALYLIEYEYNLFKEKHPDNDASFQFSGNAKTILSFVEIFWRISPVTIGVILLSEGERLKGELYSNRIFLDKIFPYVISLYLEGTQESSNLWHDFEKDISYQVMSKILDDMTNLAIEDLSIVNYDTTITVFSKLSKSIQDYIQPFSSFEGYEELEFSDNCESAFKEQIDFLVGSKFDEQRAQFYSQSDFQLMDLKSLCLTVQDTTKSLRYKLKETLVGFNIRDMTVFLYLLPFFRLINDITPKIPLDIELETNIPFTSEDIREVLDSFSFIVNCYEKAQKSLSTTQPLFSASLIFEKFSQSLSQNLINKISSEINTDLKTKILKSLITENYDDLNDSLKITKNLYDAFKLFNLRLTLIENHIWNPSFTNAEIYLIFVNTVTEVLINYSDFLISSVREDLKESNSEPPAQKSSSYQDKISQLISNISLQEEIFQPYSFQNSTCIKMNNIQWALYQFQQLDIDYQSINQVLLEDSDSFAFFNMPKLATFKIKIIKAKDLPAVDRNGLSDPYVIIRKSGDTIFQTKTIYKTLTPVWNETFEVHQHNEYENMKLEFVVWDENKIMMDQICGGSFTLNLDPKLLFNKPPVECWYDLNENGKLLLQIELNIENSDSIIYQYNLCVKHLYNANEMIFSLVISKFSKAIKYYISTTTIDNFFGFTVKLNDTVSDYLSKWTDKQNTFQTNSEQKNKYELLLTPLFEYLDQNLLIFLRNLSEYAFRSLLMECWHIFVESLITLVVPEIYDRKNTYQPLTNERKYLIMNWMEAIKEFVNHDNDGVPFDELEATPKYMLFMKLMNFDYSRSKREIIEDCEHFRVEMDKIKCSYEEKSSLNMSPVNAARNVIMITPFELENKISKYGRQFDEMMNQFTMFLRLLLLKGDVKTVDEFLSVV